VEAVYSPQKQEVSPPTPRKVPIVPAVTRIPTFTADRNDF